MIFLLAEDLNSCGLSWDAEMGPRVAASLPLLVLLAITLGGVCQSSSARELKQQVSPFRS